MAAAALAWWEESLPSWVISDKYKHSSAFCKLDFKPFCCSREETVLTLKAMQALWSAIKSSLCRFALREPVKNKQQGDSWMEWATQELSAGSYCLSVTDITGSVVFRSCHHSSQCEVSILRSIEVGLLSFPWTNVYIPKWHCRCSDWHICRWIQVKWELNCTMHSELSFVFKKDMSRLGFVRAGGAVCEGRFFLYYVSCTWVLQFPLMANSCQNYTRDKILICKAGHIRWTKFSREVNEFPSHLMETNMDWAHFFFFSPQVS